MFKHASKEDYFRKSITVPFLSNTLNKIKARFTNLHARTALELQLVPSIIENITPYLEEIDDVNIHMLFLLLVGNVFIL
jgi:hypothetical protein